MCKERQVIEFHEYYTIYQRVEGLGGGPLWRGRPALGCSPNEEDYIYTKMYKYSGRPGGIDENMK